MLQIRHGFMLVGETGGGKTTLLNLLKEALVRLPSQHPVEVKTKVINPKALTIGQLYGQSDPVSHEWSDGLVANTFR